MRSYILISNISDHWSEVMMEGRWEFWLTSVVELPCVQGTVPACQGGFVYPLPLFAYVATMQLSQWRNLSTLVCFWGTSPPPTTC